MASRLGRPEVPSELLKPPARLARRSRLPAASGWVSPREGGLLTGAPEAGADALKPGLRLRSRLPDFSALLLPREGGRLTGAPEAGGGFLMPGLRLRILLPSFSDLLAPLLGLRFTLELPFFVGAVGLGLSVSSLPGPCACRPGLVKISSPATTSVVAQNRKR